MSDQRSVAGIVLAAGSSTRMGRNKLLLRVGGETLVRHAVRVAGEAGLDPVILVTGRFRDAVEREVEDLACAPVFNPDHETGIQTSVACGVAAAPAACGAALVMLPDMPFVTARMVRTLVERRAETGAPLIVSRYGGEVNAPPILYGRSLFGEISRMRAGCGREVVRRHHDRASLVDWPADRLRDLDRPDEYESVRRELSGAGSRSGDVP
ncbi:nucleotidyltransferase family protein [Candidatus Palauibacter polyketidifaciens]|uniref:nucleotidyltransferase family protein n=1 Tax=Candidatus Palauibacter polyketidifaciens TaxID=3056740 RepID=UPI00238FF186|nr:nucleotidyltransferase family protein [Candidatus Palauibacter polyketidifaciens]MDE2721296.1 nucleotidyltransferase family protein [Candidatus Palauibacter polyketidifaciens]